MTTNKPSTQLRPGRSKLRISHLASFPLTLWLAGCGLQQATYEDQEPIETAELEQDAQYEPTGFLETLEEEVPFDISERLEGPEDPDSNIIQGRFVIRLRPAPAHQQLTGAPASPLTIDPALAEDLRRLVKDQAKHLLDPSDLPESERNPSDTSLEHTFVFESDHSSTNVTETLSDHEQVAWVEPVRRLHAFRSADDPAFDEHDMQWNMKDLDVEYAWDHVDGSGTVVAVIDAASALNGSDAPTSVLGGMDLVDWEDLPLSFTPTDSLWGHGSHVAGTVAQATDNGIGAVGVAPGATILPIRVLDIYGNSDTSVVAMGIYFAVFRGADVINLSLGGPGKSQVLEEACRFAYEQGVTVVAATGNEGYFSSIAQPAVFPTTLAVGASNIYGGPANYSNSSFELDLLAPGGDATPDADGNGYLDGILQQRCPLGLASLCNYTFSVGTSHAAPHVSGVVAMFHEMGLKDPDAIRTLLRETAEDWGYGWQHRHGYGVLDLPAVFDALGYPSPEPQ